MDDDRGARQRTRHWTCGEENNNDGQVTEFLERHAVAVGLIEGSLVGNVPYQPFEIERLR